MVLAQAAFVSKYTAKDAGFIDVNVKTIGRADATETEATNLEAACAAYSVTRGLSGTALPAAVADAAGGLPISDAGGLDMDEILVDTNSLNDTKVPDTISLDAIADAVWDEVVTAHAVASSAGLYLTSLYQTLVTRIGQCGDAGSANTIDLDDAASAVSDFYKGQLIAIVSGTGIGQSRTCISYNGTSKVATVHPNWATNPDGDSYFAVLNTGSTVVVDWADGGRLDLILDELTTQGDTNETKLGAIETDTQDIQTQVGTAGAGLTNINLPDQTMNITGNLSGSVGSVTGAVGSVTGNVGGNVVGNVTGSVGSLVGHTVQTGNSFARLGAPAGASIAADIAALPNAAAVNAEVVDALATDTYAEPGQEAPGATVSLSTKISYIYKFLRNKITNDGGTTKVYNDAGDTVDQKATTSEAAGTVTRGEFGTGP
jgi:hypothetical protein